MKLKNTNTSERFTNKLFLFSEIGVLLLFFVITNTWFKRLTEIAPTNFKMSVLYEDLSQFSEVNFYLVFPVFILLGILVLKRNLISISWKSFEGGKYVKLIVVASVLSMTWAHITYPFDYYINEAFWIERITVLLLGLLVIWRPFFVLLFVMFPIVFHFGEPYLMSHWSIMELPTKIPILFTAQYLIWLLFPKFRYSSKAFVFLLICIVASVYFPAGFAKLRQGWIANDQMHLLFINMYSDGWLGFLSNETASAFTRLLAKSDLILKFGAIVVELGCFLILIKKQYSIRFFLLGFILFHLLVYVLTGICFWPWVILEIVLLVALKKGNPFNLIVKKFTIQHIILACFLIIASTKWLKPSVFIWHDSPVNYTYKFEAEDEKGIISEIPSNYFWPKYYEFAWREGFHFIHNNPTIDVNWGVTVNGKTVAELQKIKTSSDVLNYENEKGIIFYNPKLSKSFDDYINRFVKEKKYKWTMNPWFRLFSAPQQRLVLFSGNKVYNRKERIKKIHVYQQLTFFNGERLELLRKRKVKIIDIQ